MNKTKLEAELKALQREMLQLNQAAKKIAHKRAAQTKSETTGFEERNKLRNRKKDVAKRIDALLHQLGKTVTQIELPDTEGKYNRYTDTNYRVAGQPILEQERETDVAKKTLELTVENYKRVKEETALNDRGIAEKHFSVSYTTLQSFKRDNGLVGKPGRKKKVEVENVVQVIKQEATVGELAVQGIKEGVLNASKAAEENEQLRAELAQLKVEKETLLQQLAQFENLQWKERFKKLSVQQAELDNFIATTQCLRIADHTDEQLLALIVELAEVANEDKSFKYWKVQKVVNEDALLEEVVDVLHFILSRGNVLSETGNGADTLDSVTACMRENVTIQILELIDIARHGTYQELVEHFIGLTQMFGYAWNDIEAAYDVKHTKNKARQVNGY